MKILKYNLCTIINHGTEEEPKIEEILSPVTMGWNEANEEIAKAEAYNGEYTIEDDGQSSYPVAPHNILEGEYVTIDGTLYLATQNIPSGEPVIAGQNAILTTVEEQLLLLKGE
jgi:hypothetical protein